MSGSLNSQTFVPVINFNEIPPAGDLLVPGTYVEVAADYSNVGLLNFPARILIIGQMIAAGSAAAGTLYPITRKEDGVALFGAGSPLAEQLAYTLASNPGIPVDAVGVEVVGEYNAAISKITFSGAATVNGTQAIGLAGFRVTFGINVGDTPADMADNFGTAAYSLYNAQNLPVTLDTDGTPGQITVTANFLGASGNELDVRVNPAQSDRTVPGVTITIAPATSGGTAGTGTGDITAIITAIANTWYTDIICGLNDPTTLGVLDTALASRYTAMQAVDSTAWIVWRGTQGQLVSQASGINCKFLAPIGITNTQDPSWRWAAALGGVAARALLDDPARQLRGLALPNIIAPAPTDRMFEPEQQALLQAGISTWEVAPDGTVLLQRVVSSYTQSDLGVPDTAWQDIMVAKVMTRIRWDWSNYLKLVAPRAKLADDNSMAAQYDPNVMTPRRLQGLWAARCALYERAGWIEDAATTAQQSVFAIDPNDKNRINSQRRLKIIGNDMVNAEQLLFAA